MDDLPKKRCERFLSSFGTPTTRFCRMVGLSCSAFYRWRRDDLALSDETMNRISAFLCRHGF